MDIKLKRTSILIQGMTCSSCEIKVESTLKKLEGIIDAKVNLAEAKAEISYDENIISIQSIIKAIDDIGYQATEYSKEKSSATSKAKNVTKNDSFRIDQIIGIGIILFALYMIIKRTIGFNFIPEIDSSMGYGVLFIVGVLTSLHCVAMCGGINLSQCVSHGNASDDKASKLKPSLLYNAGRVVSYTIIGGIVGAIGSVVSFSGMATGIVAVLAGLFMIIMGLNMLNIFPWLRKFNIRMPKFIGQKIYSGKVNRGPFYVGLLNGFMPCGPLQSMQLYALGTGSFIAGATSMFFFSLGTVPLMFGLGALSTILSKKFTSNLLKFSAILVIVLGVGMISRGMSLSGFNTVVASTGNTNVAVVEGNVQTVSIELGSNSYEAITVQKGIPVKFIINVKPEKINGCNETIVIKEFGIEKGLFIGENIIEFLPKESGTIPYSCWMGMIRSTITVVDDITQVQSSDSKAKQINSPAAPAAGGDYCANFAGTTTIADTTVDDVYVANAENGLQVVTITADEKGFSPNVIVLQKGLKAKFVFDPKSLNQCNSIVSFPDYGGGLDLSKGELETPELDITKDFGFTCGKSMINGFVKVVDDINNIDKKLILAEANAYAPLAGSGAAPSCH